MAFLFESFNMSILDIVLSIIILLSLLAGIMKGIIKSISWLPGLIIGYFATILFNKQLAAIFIENSVLSPLLASLISVLILMGGSYLIIRLLASIFASFLEEIGLNAVDRVLGGLFSLCLSMIVIGVLCTIIDNFSLFSSLQQYLDSSWIVCHIIRPFYAGTISAVQEVI